MKASCLLHGAAVLLAMTALSDPDRSLVAQDEPAAVLALRGMDPVDLCAGKEVAGNEKLFASWGRYRYRFTSADNRKRFLADPERFGIQWEGACARMGPLSGRGSPDRWAVHQGAVPSGTLSCTSSESGRW